MVKINKVLKTILTIVFVVCLGMYTYTQAADYPSSTTNPLGVNLDFNSKKITNIGDIITKGPWLDVRAFGAVGDDVTNDSAAIQAAINALPAGSTQYGSVSFYDGGTVYLPSGKYYIGTTSLVIDSGARVVRLLAHPGTLIRYTGTDAAIVLDATYGYLTNNVIDIDELVSTGNYGIRFTGSVGGERNTFKFGQISGHTVAAIRFEGGKKNLNVIEGKAIRGGQYGIQFVNQTAGGDEGNRIEMHGPIFNTSVAGILLEANSFYNYVEADVDLGSDHTAQKIDLAGRYNTIFLRGAAPTAISTTDPTVRLRNTATQNLILMPSMFLAGLIDDSSPGSNTIVAPIATSNYLRNSSFESWQDTGTIADWTQTNGSLTEETTDVKHGRKAAKIVSNNSFSYIRQTLPNFLKGKTVTLAGWAKAPTGNTVDQSLALDEDGTGVHTGVPKDGLWHFVAVSRSFTAGATTITAYVYANRTGVSAADTLFVDGLTLVIGESTPRFPVDDPHLVLSNTAVWDPPSISNGSSTTYVVPLRGAEVGDVATATHDKMPNAAMMISAYVPVADNVRVTILNRSGATQDIASGTLRVIVTKVGY